MEKKRHAHIGIIGSGSWATAMIKMLTDNANPKQIFWWVRKKEDIDFIQKYKHNPAYLRAVEVKIDPAHIRSDVKWIVQQSDIVVLNTPAAYLKAALSGIDRQDLQGKIIVSAIKGIVPDENLLVGDYLMQEFGVPVEQIVVIGGPCHAEEVAQEKLSYLTFACPTEKHAATVADLYETHYIQSVLSQDAVGIEYCAVLKNIYALAGGICHGLGYGDNFQAVLVSNAVREMEQFVHVIETHDRDIKASAYLGDLLVTAYSQFSRNRTFGKMIGKGYTVQSAQLEMNMVAEGYYASGCIQTIIRQQQLDMPICTMVYDVLYKQKPAGEAVALLAQNFT
ncbi:NAD(P)H-dependent glycerol-3-phosphate dehydrogenase [Sphingobacterium sp. SGG-5]|uniref:NAD(P)H-dependent glycerol-3-phosphate dehydrogenase n=1 Tax=Sphingobacterium sp. SGG-5 TaxID=2710881 RepID=UPI0013ED6B15|nr:NAD(P)H-dependent glycerol-3-phosphate dehydrogenase [Sphingobacterium sp. SGG-5]NGM62060.1 NAD(P)H-dependent glycerol-3-phosphate dehydrogenase [Sphingobacterium sp. SGG-5]